MRMKVGITNGKAKTLQLATLLIALLTFAARAGALTFEDAKKSYDYDKTVPLDIKIRATTEMPSYSKIYFSYVGYQGERVPAILIMPKPRIKPMHPERATVQGAFPVMFFMHFHVSDKSLTDVMLNWPGYGIAIMAIDGVFRGEREKSGQDILMADPAVTVKNIRHQVFDILRGFDVIRGWKGLDPGRIGYMGISMGSITGSVATSINLDIKSVILADGAADFPTIFQVSDYGQVQQMKEFIAKNNISREALKKEFDYVDPLTYAPHFETRPVMMLNGKQDTTFPVPTVKLLYDNLVANPKKIIWYNSGHVLPFDRLLSDSLKWFRETL